MNDTEKLDWLEKNFLSIIHDGAVGRVDMSGNHIELSYFDKEGEIKKGRGKTIRELINGINHL